MGVVSVAFAYNAFVVPMRASFPVQTELSLPAWLFFDYLSDTVYVLDIVLVQFHLSWRVQGVLEVVKFHCHFVYSVMFYLLDYSLKSKY